MRLKLWKLGLDVQYNLEHIRYALDVTVTFGRRSLVFQALRTYQWASDWDKSWCNYYLIKE